MSPKYLLVVNAGHANWPAAVERLRRLTGFEIGFSHARFAALVNRRCRSIAAGDRACVIGTLFHRHGPARPISSLEGTDAALILRSGGDALLRRFWGGYVAAIAGPDSVRILRDPSATISCYAACGPGLVAFTPDAEILVECGLADVSIDWGELARQFFGAGVSTPATTLRGIRELLAGFAVEIPGDLDRQEPCWTPWDHIQDQERERDRDAERLFRTIEHCLSAWASGHQRPLVSVSGGLDSSIVTACLARAGANVTCLTMYTDDPSGDERLYARALCSHLGVSLIERPYRLDEIDITEPLGAHLPRPKDRTHALAYERAHLGVAREFEADAFVTGNGGDSVFGYSQSAAAAADRFLCQGLHLGVLRTLRDICRHTGCSMAQAATQAWRIGRALNSYRCRPDPLFLHPEVVADLTENPIDHGWLQAPENALPGKAAHVASILRVQHALEPNRGRYLPVLNPLMSQPIVETCLTIPTWEWRAGGLDRSLARRAFAKVLPPIILRRHVKGGPSSFAAQILDHFRAPIRERLLDGALAGHGIIDKSAVQLALADGRSCTNEERVRILEFVATEAWLGSWSPHHKYKTPQTDQGFKASTANCSPL